MTVIVSPTLELYRKANSEISHVGGILPISPLRARSLSRRSGEALNYYPGMEADISVNYAHGRIRESAASLSKQILHSFIGKLNDMIKAFGVVIRYASWVSF